MIFVKPHANGPQFFLLPSVLGTFESARKLLRPGYRPGYEFSTAFRALHRSRILFNSLTSKDESNSNRKTRALSGTSAHPRVRSQHDLRRINEQEHSSRFGARHSAGFIVSGLPRYKGAARERTTQSADIAIAERCRRSGKSHRCSNEGKH